MYTHAKVYVMYIDLYICIKKIKRHVHKIYLTKYWLHTCLKQVQTRHVCNEHSPIRME